MPTIPFALEGFLIHPKDLSRFGMADEGVAFHAPYQTINHGLLSSCCGGGWCSHVFGLMKSQLSASLFQASKAFV